MRESEANCCWYGDCGGGVGLRRGGRQVDVLDMLIVRQAAGHLNLAGARPEHLDGD